MAFDFPSSPTVGQAYNGYTWDGEKWALSFSSPNQNGIIAIKVFTASGTYVPSANMTTCLIECLGGGGGGGGVGASTTVTMVASGGGAGGASRKMATAVQIDSSQAVVVGGGGAGGPAAMSPTGNGVQGGDTSVGSLCVAKGANGGVGGASSCGGGAGGGLTGAVGDFTAPGATGGTAAGYQSTSTGGIGMGGQGANSAFGGGGLPGLSNGSSTAGFPALGYGSGGGGASSYNNAAGAVGGAGTPGIVIITEYGLTALAPSVQGTVRYDLPQALTVPQQTQARQNVYATPFDALAYNGLQINAACDVSQELGTAGLAAQGYFCDGWGLYWAGATMALSGFGGPIVYVPGINGLLYTYPRTSQASLAAGDYAFVRQQVEGYRIKRLMWGTASAQPLTIGFWSQHSKTGVYGGSVRNGAGNRACAFTYTQVAANVAQYNVVTIPGDMTGTWNIDNTVGIQLSFAIASGTGYIAAAVNTWYAAGYVTGPGQVNGVDSTSNVFRLTGVVVLPGNEAPSAAALPNIIRPLDQELTICQRYYENMGAGLVGLANAASQVTFGCTFKVRKRTIPTVTILTSAPQIYPSTGYQTGVGSIAAYQAAYDTFGGAVNVNGFAGLNPGTAVIANNSDMLKFDARL